MAKRSSRKKAKVRSVNTRRQNKAGTAGYLVGSAYGVFGGKGGGGSLNRSFAHNVGRGVIGGAVGEVAARGAYKAGSFPKRKLEAHKIVNAGQQSHHYQRRKVKR